MAWGQMGAQGEGGRLAGPQAGWGRAKPTAQQDINQGEGSLRRQAGRPPGPNRISVRVREAGWQA